MALAQPAPTAESSIPFAAAPDDPPWLASVANDHSYEWARIAWRRAKAVKGAWYDAAKADLVVKNWPVWFKLTEDRFAGVPFRLTIWQEIIVRLLIGWKTPTEIIDPVTGLTGFAQVRLFRRLLLWIPRKNGKSEFLAALSLLFFAIEGTHSGQGFVFARDENQAKIIFEKMKAMVSLTPALRSVKPFKKVLYIPNRKARFELLPGKAEGKHGRSATVITGDEMHEWKTLELVTVLRQSTGARLQPIELYASTAGPKTNPAGTALWEESEKILDGRIDDPTTLVVIFAAANDADWRAEATWRRANPSLGLSPTIAFLRREAAIANDNPRAEAHFRCFHLNQWIDAHTRWLNIKKWDACADPQRLTWKNRLEALRGRLAYAGFDISSTRDVTALVWLFPPLEGESKWILVPRFWVPEDTLKERVRADGVDYDKWLAAGALETTPGDFVDQNYLKLGLEEGLEMFDVQRIAYDSWNATKLISDLQADGVDPELMLKVRQGVQSLGEPTKRFEKLVYSGDMDHGGQPMLRWMAGNAVVRFDENLNYMPAKKRSPEKIDGISAAVNAVAASMGEIEPPSVYETHGILEIEV